MTGLKTLGDEVLGMGAEATVVRTATGIEKRRSAKGYRHPDIDGQLRTSRTKQELRLLVRAKAAGISVPDAQAIDETTIALSEAPGKQLKTFLDEDPILAHQAGRIIAKLHDTGIAHGDLTTSNLMYDPATHTMTLIDFGLAFPTHRDEDKAVDLHLMHQALASKHHSVLPRAYRHFLAGYRDSPHAEQVIERLRAVQARGRNKHAV